MSPFGLQIEFVKGKCHFREEKLFQLKSSCSVESQHLEHVFHFHFCPHITNSQFIKSVSIVF